MLYKETEKQYNLFNWLFKLHLLELWGRTHVYQHLHERDFKKPGVPLLSGADFNFLTRCMPAVASMALISSVRDVDQYVYVCMCVHSLGCQLLLT